MGDQAETQEGTTEAVVEQAPAPAAAAASVDLAAAKELILKAHPQAVAELVAGETFEALLASVPAAEAAYQRVAASVQEGTPAAAAAAAAAVAAGAAVRTPAVDVSALSPMGKIQYAVRTRNAAS